MTNDGVESHEYDNGGQDHIEHMDGHMDGISSRWDVALKIHLIFGWRPEI